MSLPGHFHNDGLPAGRGGAGEKPRRRFVAGQAVADHRKCLELKDDKDASLALFEAVYLP
jgi:hypothetical protein